MTVEVKLPQYGMGMLEGTIIEWLKSEGDRVQEGDVIAEVEASKATSELTAPCSGVLSKIVVAADNTVPIFTVLALIEVSE